MRCDHCNRPCIGTALCDLCARDLEDLAQARNDEWWRDE